MGVGLLLSFITPMGFAGDWCDYALDAAPRRQEKNLNTTLLIIKGLIADQSPVDQQRIKSVEAKLRAAIAEDAEAARFAFALIGAEMETAE